MFLGSNWDCELGTVFTLFARIFRHKLRMSDFAILRCFIVNRSEKRAKNHPKLELGGFRLASNSSVKKRHQQRKRDKKWPKNRFF